MKYDVVYKNSLKKDIKLMAKRGCDLSKFEETVNLLRAGEKLPARYKDHELKGNYQGHRECHIEPDWLLIYKIENDILILTLTRTGAHSDLF